MSKIAIICVPLALLFSSLWPAPARADELGIVSFQMHFRDSYSLLFSSRFTETGGMGRVSFGGQSTRILDKLTAALVDGDALAKATADVLAQPKASVVYLTFDQWRGVTPQEGKTFVTISTMSQSTSTGYDLGFTVRFDHLLDADKAKAIVSRYAELIAPNVKKLSEQLFTEGFEPAMEEAKKALEAADGKVNQLEGDRSRLQLRSYEELPYEKVADHLADLQRQFLALKLSLVGMDAKRNEIERQIAIANARLKENAERSAKEASVSEIVDTLNKLVELKMKHVDYLIESNQKVRGSVPQGDIDDANARVLETKLQLLAAQAKKSTPVANDQLDSLRADLTRLTIDRSEQQARLEYLEKTQAEVQERIANRASLDRDIKRIDEQLPTANVALRTAQSRIKELEDAKAAFKPIDLAKADN